MKIIFSRRCFRWAMCNKRIQIIYSDKPSRPSAWPCHVTSQKTVTGTLIISNCKTVDRVHASDMHASSSRMTDCGNSPWRLQLFVNADKWSHVRIVQLQHLTQVCHYVSVDVTKSLNANFRLHCDIYEERLRAASWRTFTNEELRFTVLAFYTMCTSVMSLDNRVCRFRNTDVSQTRLKVAFSSSIYRLRSRIAANLVCCLSSTSRLWWWLRCRLFFQWTTWDVFYSAFQSTFSTLVYSTVYSDWHTDAVVQYALL